MKKITFLILFLSGFSITSCIPALFTAGAATTVVASKDRSFGSTVDDVAIAMKIKKEFMAKGFKKLYTKIEIEVVQRRVLLTGKVETDEDIINSVDIAWSVNNVKEVVNELRVSEDSNKFDAAQYAKDTWITARIKAATFFKRDIKFVNFTVLTARNVVYLFGTARTEEELQEVADLAAKIEGVEKVVNFVHIKEATPRPLDENSEDLHDEALRKEE